MHWWAVCPLEGTAWVFIMYPICWYIILPFQGREEVHVALPYWKYMKIHWNNLLNFMTFYCNNLNVVLRISKFRFSKYIFSCMQYNKAITFCTFVLYFVTKIIFIYLSVHLLPQKSQPKNVFILTIQIYSIGINKKIPWIYYIPCWLQSYYLSQQEPFNYIYNNCN